MVDERVLWSLVGVLLVVLTTLAHRNPNSYRRLSVGLIPTLLGLVFASVGWNMGQNSAYKLLGPHLSPESVHVFVSTFIEAIEAKYVYDAAMLIVIAYLFFLGYLPHVLKSKVATSAAE